MVRRIALFVEDSGHRRVIGTLVCRLARCHGIEVRFDWRNAIGGHGKVVNELREFLREPVGQDGHAPDMIVVATDANCSGLNEREKELKKLGSPDASIPVIYAVPDPHVERWLLLDGAAFHAVLGKGCDAPDRKCDRDRYKEVLIRAVRSTGRTPILGGLEHASAIMRALDIERASRADRSFGRFVDSLRTAFESWRQ